MKLISRRNTVYILLAFALLICSALFAQEPTGPDIDDTPSRKSVTPTAPVPAPIASATKVFIANAPANFNLNLSGGRDQPYNAFYAI